jgi:hypothetical protein
MSASKGTVLDDIGEVAGGVTGGVVGMVAGSVAGLIEVVKAGDWSAFGGKFEKVADTCYQHGTVIGRKHFANLALSLITSILFGGGGGGDHHSA